MNYWDRTAATTDPVFEKWVGDTSNPVKRHIFDMIMHHGYRRIIDVGAGPCTIAQLADELEYAIEYWPIDQTQFFLQRVEDIGLTKFGFGDAADENSWPDDAGDVAVLRHVLEHNDHWPEIVAKALGHARHVIINLFGYTEGPTEYKRQFEDLPNNLIGFQDFASFGTTGNCIIARKRIHGEWIIELSRKG